MDDIHDDDLSAFAKKIGEKATLEELHGLITNNPPPHQNANDQQVNSTPLVLTEDTNTHGNTEDDQDTAMTATAKAKVYRVGQYLLNEAEYNALASERASTSLTDEEIARLLATATMHSRPRTQYLDGLKQLAANLTCLPGDLVGDPTLLDQSEDIIEDNLVQLVKRLHDRRKIDLEEETLDEDLDEAPNIDDEENQLEDQSEITSVFLVDGRELSVKDYLSEISQTAKDNQEITASRIRDHLDEQITHVTVEGQKISPEEYLAFFPPEEDKSLGLEESSVGKDQPESSKRKFFPGLSIAKNAQDIIHDPHLKKLIVNNIRAWMTDPNCSADELARRQKKGKTILYGIDHRHSVINLSNGKFTSLPLGLGGLQDQVKKLILRGNRLPFLSRSLSQLTNLEVLDAKRNLLQEPPSWLGQLKKLQVANFKENKILRLPLSHIAGLGPNVLLKLSGNDLSTATAVAIRKMQALPNAPQIAFKRKETFTASWNPSHRDTEEEGRTTLIAKSKPLSEAIVFWLKTNEAQKLGLTESDAEKWKKYNDQDGAGAFSSFLSEMQKSYIQSPSASLRNRMAKLLWGMQNDMEAHEDLQSAQQDDNLCVSILAKAEEAIGTCHGREFAGLAMFDGEAINHQAMRENWGPAKLLATGKAMFRRETVERVADLDSEKTRYSKHPVRFVRKYDPVNVTRRYKLGLRDSLKLIGEEDTKLNPRVRHAYSSRLDRAEKIVAALESENLARAQEKAKGLITDHPKAWISKQPWITLNTFLANYEPWAKYLEKNYKAEFKAVKDLFKEEKAAVSIAWDFGKANPADPTNKYSKDIKNEGQWLARVNALNEEEAKALLDLKIDLSQAFQNYLGDAVTTELNELFENEYNKAAHDSTTKKKSTPPEIQGDEAPPMFLRNLETPSLYDVPTAAAGAILAQINGQPYQIRAATAKDTFRTPIYMLEDIKSGIYPAVKQTTPSTFLIVSEPQLKQIANDHTFDKVNDDFKKKKGLDHWKQFTLKTDPAFERNSKKAADLDSSTKRKNSGCKVS